MEHEAEEEVPVVQANAESTEGAKEGAKEEPKEELKEDKEKVKELMYGQNME